MEKPVEELVFVVEDAPEGGYLARAIGASIVTEGDTLDEVRRQVADAVSCHYGDRGDRPRIVRLHMVRDEILSL